MSTKYKHGDRVPTETLAARLDELSLIVANQGAEPLRFRDAFTMRVPAELDRDADLVLHEAAKRLRERSIRKLIPDSQTIIAAHKQRQAERARPMAVSFDAFLEGAVWAFRYLADQYDSATRPAELPNGELHGED